MNESSPLTAVRLSRATRIGLAFIGCGLLSLLVIASRLSPDPNGLGTHQQLGLPPCTFYAWTGHRCPLCGMTTSWAHVVRGELAPAAGASFSGTLLAFAAMLLAGWALISAARGRALIGWPNDRFLAIAGLTVAAIVLVDWLRRLAGGE